MNIIILLKKAVKIKIIRLVDFYFAQFIGKKNNVIILVSACLSYESSNGHLFLPIEYFKRKNFFSSSNQKFIKQILTILGEKINWLVELLQSSSVSDGSIVTPIVLYKNKVYLYKIWSAEKNIFHTLYNKNQTYKVNYQKCFNILNNLFPGKTKNFHKIAVALILINNITFIIGGPGTGKTTIILKIIIALIKNRKKTIKIQLSAPTGKATTRLNDIISSNNNIFDIFLSEKEKQYLPSKAKTIHQLLGIEKISQKSLFNKNNLLNVNVLIVDETSMVDILIMEKIFCSIEKGTKLIFIGDHNQLRPIETGSVLRKICIHANNRYSSKQISILKKLMEYKISHKNSMKKSNYISDKIALLKKNYRFNNSSGIYTLSHGIKNQKLKIINYLFNNTIKNVCFYEINSIKQYENMIVNIALNYENFWNKIYRKEKIEKIIASFQEYQVLCAVRDGIFGVNILNKKLEGYMHKKKKIKYFYIKNQAWYVGKPIMITNNNYYLGLFNGNIGITNINKEGVIQVSFLKENSTIIHIPVNILRNYETAWSITIHKSQGSEFNNVAIVLPNSHSPVLNKDVLYTATTRSRKTITIFSNKKIFVETTLKST